MIVPIDQNIQVVGMSVGRSHCLCWDIEGRIYSWGDN